MNQLYDSRVLPTLRLAIIVDYFAGRERIQRESVYIYTIYSTRNRASGFVITDRRQEGGGSYSHVRAYEKLQPFHHLHVKFNAIRAILLRSDAFSLNAIRYPLSLSLFLFRALFGRERERERAASVKIEAWKITVTKRKRGSISRGRARIGEIRIGITGHRLRERTRKGAGNRGHRRLSTPRSRGDP